MWPVDSAVDVRSTRTVTAVGTTADTGCSQARITAAAWLLGPVAAADTMAAIGHERPLTTVCFVAFQSEQVKQAGLLRSL